MEWMQESKRWINNLRKMQEWERKREERREERVKKEWRWIKDEGGTGMKGGGERARAHRYDRKMNLLFEVQEFQNLLNGARNGFNHSRLMHFQEVSWSSGIRPSSESICIRPYSANIDNYFCLPLYLACEILFTCWWMWKVFLMISVLPCFSVWWAARIWQLADKKESSRNSRVEILPATHISLCPHDWAPDTDPVWVHLWVSTSQTFFSAHMSARHKYFFSVLMSEYQTDLFQCPYEWVPDRSFSVPLWVPDTNLFLVPLWVSTRQNFFRPWT